MVQTVARATGPLLALTAFYLLNDQWTLPTLSWVLTGGLVMTIVPSLVLVFMFHDKYTVGLENEAITVSAKTIEERKARNLLQKAAQTTVAAERIAGSDWNKHPLPTTTLTNDGLTPVDEKDEEDDDEGDITDDAASAASVGRVDDYEAPDAALGTAGSGTGSPRTTTAAAELVDPLADDGNNGDADGGASTGTGSGGDDGDSDDDDDDDEDLKDSCCCKCCAGVRAIPWIILASNTVTGFATGMTVKFFPLFFKNEVCLTPASVNIIYAATPFLQVRACVRACVRLRARACVAAVDGSGCSPGHRQETRSQIPRWLVRSFICLSPCRPWQRTPRGPSQSAVGACGRCKSNGCWARFAYSSWLGGRRYGPSHG